jgi:hypothetical protein
MSNDDYRALGICKKGSNVDTFLAELQEHEPMISNRSQAVRYCIHQVMTEKQPEWAEQELPQ